MMKILNVPHILPFNSQADLSSPSVSKAFPRFQKRKGEWDYHRDYIRNYLIGNNCHGIEILMNVSGVSQAFNYVTYNAPPARNYNYTGSVDVNDVLMLEKWNHPNDDEYEVQDPVLNLSNDRKM
ncbi:hypothetical protein Trydic_g14500 [Trypoxylus dichotomus]